MVSKESFDIVRELLHLAPNLRRERLREMHLAPQIQREIEEILSFDENTPTSSFLESAPSLMSHYLHSVPTATSPPAAERIDATSEPTSIVAPYVTIRGYHLLREINRGGQAVVFEATQQSTGRRVAVKVLKDGSLAAPRERARLDREVQVLAALNHPNIVQIIDRGTSAEGALFVAMEYVSGQALDEYLGVVCRDNPERRDCSEMLRVFLKICDAVNAAHLRGVVHRDLKPSNIRVDENGEPHILDFGLAHTGLPTMTDEDTPQPVSITGQFLGSLPWASPEQAEGIGSKIDQRTDVYSLGVILYQLLTGGHFPYEVAGTMRDVLNNIITAQPPPPSQVTASRHVKEAARRRRLRRQTPLLNPIIDAIVLKALAKRRDDRYQSAGELARDVANYLSGRPTLAAGATRRRWRTPMLTAVAAGALVLAVIGLTSALSSRRPQTAPQAGDRMSAITASPDAPAPTAARTGGNPFAFDPVEQVVFLDTFDDPKHPSWEVGEKAEDRDICLFADGTLTVPTEEHAKPMYNCQVMLPTPISIADNDVAIYVRMRVATPKTCNFLFFLRNSAESIQFMILPWKSFGTRTGVNGQPVFWGMTFTAVESPDINVATSREPTGWHSFRLGASRNEQNGMKISIDWFDEASRRWRPLAHSNDGALEDGSARRTFLLPDLPLDRLFVRLEDPEAAPAIDTIAVTRTPRSR